MSESYDKKCKELAELFLADEEHSSEDVAALALAIQRAVDYWLQEAPEGRVK